MLIVLGFISQTKGMKIGLLDLKIAGGGYIQRFITYEFAEVPERRPWEFTFVKGDGYVDFSGQGGSSLGF